ncbi:hypothetical protein DVK07_02235 [Halorubrum sp. Atlit-26R]|nr:hypothetical protein DVK07_02235 [Halorubrum sp. Atlit-26R]
MFVVDLPVSIYKYTAGALAVFAVDPQATIYKRVAGSLEVSTVDPRSITYKLRTRAFGGSGCCSRFNHL